MPEITQLGNREAGLKLWSSRTGVQALNLRAPSCWCWTELGLCLTLEELMIQQGKQRKEIVAKRYVTRDAMGGNPGMHAAPQVYLTAPG